MSCLTLVTSTFFFSFSVVVVYSHPGTSSLGLIAANVTSINLFASVRFFLACDGEEKVCEGVGSSY